MRIQDAQALAIKILLTKMAMMPNAYGDNLKFHHNDFMRDVNELSKRLSDDLVDDINLALLSDKTDISK